MRSGEKADETSTGAVGEADLCELLDRLDPLEEKVHAL